MGAWLCAECLQAIPRLAPPHRPERGETRNVREPPPAYAVDGASLRGMYFVSYHVRPLREAVHALKYEGLRVLAAPLGELLAECWRAERLRADVVVPVPLHPARLRQRGYNQSALLARELSRRIGIPLREDALARTRNTPAQVGLSAAERHANVSGAFGCADDGLRDLHVLVVDDVLTTGATLEACAEALQTAGVASVSALTLTRALPTDTP